jgi:hypothetical protein
MNILLVPDAEATMAKNAWDVNCLRPIGAIFIKQKWRNL